MHNNFLNIGEILYILKKRWWILVIIPVITASLGWSKASKMKPSYSASTQLFVGTTDNMLESYPKEVYEAYSSFLTKFQEVLSLEEYFNEMLIKRGIEKSAGEVRGGLGFGISENLPIITISFRSGVKEGVEETLTAMTAEIGDQIKGINPEAKPKQIGTIYVNTHNPNKAKLPVIGFAVGLILALGIIIAIDYLDDTVGTVEQLEHILPVPVLGDIPVHDKELKKGQKDVNSR